jgi:hypothetical protein
MSTPQPPRWTRVTSPVTPTVVTFPDGDSAKARPFTRITNVTNPTVLTFEPLPVLTIVLRRHPESDATLLPLHAALLIQLASELDRGLGGDGFVFDPDGTREEPTRLAIRLIPKLSRAAGDRLKAVEAELSRRAEEARAEAVRCQDTDLRSAIQTLQDQAELAAVNHDRLLLGAFERVIELAV